MKLRYIIPAAVLSTLFAVGGASAQTVGGVTTTTTAITSPIAAGTDVNLGTISIVGPFGTTVTSIPVTVTAGGGASASQLSNCQLHASSGAAVSNLVATPGAGANTFTLNTPAALNATVPHVFTVRCDVATGVPASSTFTISAGTPSVVAGGSLSANLDIAPSVPRGSQDVTLSNISLGTNATTSARITAIPLTISAANGALVTHLSDCRVRDSSNLSGSLSGSINPAGGTTVFSISPVTIGANASEMLALTCDVSATTPVGGTFTISLIPSAVTAVDAVTGATITPTAVVGIGPNGLPAATSGTIVVTASTPGGGNTDDDDTPGIPNTGAGGAQTAIVLGFAALLALLGGLYLRRRIA